MSTARAALMPLDAIVSHTSNFHDHSCILLTSIGMFYWPHYASLHCCICRSFLNFHEVISHARTHGLFKELPLKPTLVKEHIHRAFGASCGRDTWLYDFPPINALSAPIPGRPITTIIKRPACPNSWFKDVRSLVDHWDAASRGTNAIMDGRHPGKLLPIRGRRRVTSALVVDHVNNLKLKTVEVIRARGRKYSERHGASVPLIEGWDNAQQSTSHVAPTAAGGGCNALA